MTATQHQMHEGTGTQAYIHLVKAVCNHKCVCKHRLNRSVLLLLAQTVFTPAVLWPSFLLRHKEATQRPTCLHLLKTVFIWKHEFCRVQDQFLWVTPLSLTATPTDTSLCHQQAGRCWSTGLWNHLQVYSKTELY